MSKHFTGQSGLSLELERVFRRFVRLLGERQRANAYQFLTSVVPRFVGTQFDLSENICLVRQNNQTIAFPRPLPMVNFQHIANGYQAWLAGKYSLPGFVEVQSGDLVVDCGAYVGGFSLSAVEKASAVHLFEPAPMNADCARRNLADFPNAVINEAGLFSSTCQLQLNLSQSGVDHSVLTPDKGETGEQHSIKVWNLADYCRANDLPVPDFVKIEAEGAELEVLKGLENLRPSRLAIDVSPEMDGESPEAEIRQRLEDQGYVCKVRGSVLFALCSEKAI